MKFVVPYPYPDPNAISQLAENDRYLADALNDGVHALTIDTASFQDITVTRSGYISNATINSAYIPNATILSGNFTSVVAASGYFTNLFAASATITALEATSANIQRISNINNLYATSGYFGSATIGSATITSGNFTAGASIGSGTLQTLIVDHSALGGDSVETIKYATGQGGYIKFYEDTTQKLIVGYDDSSNYGVISTIDATSLKLGANNTPYLSIQPTGAISDIIGPISTPTSLTLDNGVTDEGTIYWDGGTAKYLQGDIATNSLIYRGWNFHQFYGTDDTLLAMVYLAHDNDTAVNGVYQRFYRGRGTLASPAAVVANDWVGALDFYPFPDVAPLVNPSARIKVITRATVDTTHAPCDIVFATGDGSAVATDRMSIKANGDISGIGGALSTPKSLTLDNGATDGGRIYWDGGMSLWDGVTADGNYRMFNGALQNIFYGQNDSAGVISLHSYDNDTPANGSTYYGVRARGTLTAPTAVVAGDTILSMKALPKTNDGWNSEIPASIDFKASATITSSAVPVGISFLTGDGATVRTERLRITSDGDAYREAKTLFSSTVTGWDAGFTQEVYYKVVLGNQMWVNYAISGTSTNDFSRFSLPYSAAATPTAQFHTPCAALNSGAGQAGAMASIAANQNIMNVYANQASGAWLSSGRKTAKGSFFLEIAL